MWVCEGSRIDWTAVAAIIALAIWMVDGWRRRGERAATRRVLAQIMTTPVGLAQIEIAHFRTLVMPSTEDQSIVLELMNSGEKRREFANKALQVKFELPTQFLDKADVFGQRTSNRLAWAFSQTTRLHTMWRLFAETSDQVDDDEMGARLKHALVQIQETEQAIGEAFNAVLADGRASAWI
ncbi:hypothetical protein [Xanthomonas sacchari]|uniref:hypothetical protein n=1 Tax=Xanthomonas sacchari TaxID=56458 RepID=UPI00225E3A28|nr:hypothetical protein [Xanthomonas sacchari]